MSANKHKYVVGTRRGVSMVYPTSNHISTLSARYPRSNPYIKIHFHSKTRRSAFLSHLISRILFHVPVAVLRYTASSLNRERALYPNEVSGTWDDHLSRLIIADELKRGAKYAVLIP
jgi:hypothetical protein